MTRNPQNGCLETAPIHRVLLTFDDGPSAANSIPVLDELGVRGIRAIFFVQGQKLENREHRAVVERASAEGHVIGNHTYSHPRLTRLMDDEIKSEIRNAAQMIGESDHGIKLWRPPYGDHDDRVDNAVASLGYTRMLWNIDSRDWQGPQHPDICADRVVKRIQLRIARGYRNSVCLFHDAFPAAACLRRLFGRIAELPGVQFADYDPCHPEGLRLPGEASLPAAFPSDLCSFRLEDSLVLSRSGRNTLYVLNETGRLMWEHLSRGAPETEAARSLALEYGVSEDVANRDLQAALADWRVRGLLGPKAPELEDPGPWPHFSDGVERSRSGCAEERFYRFLGVSFRIRYCSAELVDAIHPRFANLEAPAGSPDDRLLEACLEEEGWDSAEAVAYRLFFEIVSMAHPNLEPMACLHASLVGYGNGSVALVGNNGSGKSTLAAGLTSRAYRVLSDDRVFLDSATQRPVAAPNAVNLKQGSWSPLAARCPAVAGLPIIRSGGEELRFLPVPPLIDQLLPPVTCVFFPKYDAAAATASIPLTAIQAVERMVAAGSWISSDKTKLERFLEWVKELRCYALPYSSLDEAIVRMREYIGA